MTSQQPDRTVDTLVLRFDGENADGSPLHELRAAHVAEVLQGVVGLTSDFIKGGALGDEGPAGTEILVRPAQEGSFEILIDVIRFGIEHKELIGAAVGTASAPSLTQMLWYSARAARADVSDFEHLGNGYVKIKWQDNTVDEVPDAAWRELRKLPKRRKRHLQQILRPLSDERVSALELRPPVVDENEETAEAGAYTLRRADYDAVLEEEEPPRERSEEIEVEARMSAIDFDDPTKWKVKTVDGTRTVIVKDDEFLGRIANGLAIRATDIFRLIVREDTVEQEGRRTRRTWTVLKVDRFRRASHDRNA